MVVCSLNSFSATNGQCNGAVGGSGLGDRVGCVGGDVAGQWIGPSCTVGWDGGWELRIIWEKYDLAGNMTEDQGRLNGLHDIFSHVGREI